MSFVQLSFLTKFLGFTSREENPPLGVLTGKVTAARPARNKKLTNKSRRVDPLLQGIWLEIRREWFPDNSELDAYSVVWSGRGQKRTLASCNMAKKKVCVARELNYDLYLKWLDPLLYHEMCHAYLRDCAVGRREIAHRHGREFKAIERRHPQIKEMNDWIRAGGWQKAVRSDRAKRAYAERNKI